MSDKIEKDMNEKPLEESESYPIMPLRNTVLFPQQVIPIYIGRDKSLKLINELPSNSKHIVVVAQEDGSIEDPNPVVFIENYLCFSTKGDVPLENYTINLGEGKIVKNGSDITIVTCGYLVNEALAAATLVTEKGINVEVLDLRSICPIDEDLILKSVAKTRRLIIADPGHKTNGLSAEICAIVSENIQDKLLSNIIRIISNKCYNNTWTK